MKKIAFILFLSLIFNFAANQPHGFCADGKSASDSLHSFIDTMKSMEFPIKDELKHEEKLKLANAAVDLETMGKKALGGHWSKMSAPQQNEFMELLWRLIENIAYPRSQKFLGSLPLDYSEPKAVEKGFEITTIVKNEDEALNAPIVYDLYEQGGQWKIYDIFLDGVTITEDLKFQFEKIIEESSYQGLLDRMRERLDKAKQETHSK